MGLLLSNSVVPRVQIQVAGTVSASHKQDESIQCCFTKYAGLLCLIET